MQRILKESGYSNVLKKSKTRQPKPETWEDNSRCNIDPEEEVKRAFTKMTEKQLQFHLQVGGKNAQYAKAILNFRNKQKQS